MNAPHPAASPCAACAAGDGRERDEQTMMLTQTPLRELYTDPTPRRTRTNLPPIPALMLTTPSADLEGNMRDVRTVAGVLTMLIDGAAHMTDGDREMVRRLYEIACENY